MTTPALPFHPPGPGVWAMDAGHFPRPVFGLMEDILPVAFEAGFRGACATYGLGLETMLVRMVNGFPYMQPKPLGAPAGAAPPPRWVLKPMMWLLAAFHPELRRRMGVARTLFQDRPWRAAVAEWDTVVKPRTIALHTEFAAVDLTTLDDAALADFLVRGCDHAIAMVTQDHGMNFSFMLPQGDFLVTVGGWTGLSATDLLELARGHSDVSAGDSPEQRHLVAALAADAEARAVLEGGGAAPSVLARLTAWPGEVGVATRAWRIIWGGAIAHGIDLSTPSVEEDPAPALQALRITLGGGRPRRAGTTPEAAEAVRARVPEPHRADYDEMLADLRQVYRLRDERHLYGALPTLGLARRLLVEAGRRLQARGAVHAAHHAEVARLAELTALLRGQPDAPSADALAARVALRDSLDASKVPLTLGGTPDGGPDPDVMPNEGARRATRALNAYLSAVDDGKGAESAVRERLEGMAVSRGRHEGIARVCATSGDLARIQPGDVLVATVTTPAINIVLPILGAIVTDRGGALSHAAIVSREYGIPGVVGTRDATTRIPDGARVVVDGDLGIVTVLP